MKKVILDVQQIGKRFGGLKAIEDFSFQLYEGEI
jgi:ABC-type branched-subunit amino acid transport system ATPase component